MTPTLMGRWQTRLLLLSTVGTVVTLPFARGWIAPPGHTYWLVLLWIGGLGVILWDPLYTYLQSFRWDHDWPAVLQLVSGIWEGFFVYVPLRWLLGILNLHWLDNLSLPSFLAHYSLVWLGVFTASQTIMRILFPRWRFRGGKWL